jgi:hypothetical protein
MGAEPTLFPEQMHYGSSRREGDYSRKEAKKKLTAEAGFQCVSCIVQGLTFGLCECVPVDESVDLIDKGTELIAGPVRLIVVELKRDLVELVDHP